MLRWRSTHERHQRLRLQDGDGERHRFGECEQPADAGHLSHGHPVTGKNLFPSNIQGLPTWSTRFASARTATPRGPHEVDLVVALNPATYAKDVASVRPGGYLLYDSSWPLEPELVREGITILGIPFGKICVEHFQGDRDRTLLRNIVYAGALAALLKLDMDLVGRDAGARSSRRRRRLLDANNTRDPAGLRLRDARTTSARCPSISSGWTPPSDSIIIDGNTAAALGAVFAGATVGAWYPITPSTSLMEAFKEFCRALSHRARTPGSRKYCIHSGGGRALRRGHGDRCRLGGRALVHEYSGTRASR